MKSEIERVTEIFFKQAKIDEAIDSIYSDENGIKLILSSMDQRRLDALYAEKDRLHDEALKILEEENN